MLSLVTMRDQGSFPDSHLNNDSDKRKKTATTSTNNLFRSLYNTQYNRARDTTLVEPQQLKGSRTQCFPGLSSLQMYRRLYDHCIYHCDVAELGVCKTERERAMGEGYIQSAIQPLYPGFRLHFVSLGTRKQTTNTVYLVDVQQEHQITWTSILQLIG